MTDRDLPDPHALADDHDDLDWDRDRLGPMADHATEEPPRAVVPARRVGFGGSSLDGVLAALRGFYLTVEVLPGAEARSAGTFNPKGVVCHWTAGPRGTTRRASLGVVTDGRPGLPGPLCNFYLDRAGIVVVVALGRANHAGVGGWNGLVGNSSVWGIEAESGGDDDWTYAQRNAYPRLLAALCRYSGFPPENVCGHCEWAPTRKIDIRDWPMPAMRQSVTALLAQEDDDMPTAEEIATATLAAFRRENYRRDVWEHPIKTPRGAGGRVASAEVILADLDGMTLDRFVSALVTGLLDTPIERKDIGAPPTTLRQVLRWSDRNTDRLAEEIRKIPAGEVDAAAVTAAVRDALGGEDIGGAVADTIARRLGDTETTAT